MCSTSTIPMHIFTYIYFIHEQTKNNRNSTSRIAFSITFSPYSCTKSLEVVSLFRVLFCCVCVCAHNLSIFRSDVVTWSGFMIVKSLWNHLECDCFSALHFDNIQPVSQLALRDCVVVLLLLLLLLLWSGSVSFFVNSGSLQQPWNLVFCMPFSLDLVHRASSIEHQTIEPSSYLKADCMFLFACSLSPGNFELCR